MRLDLFSHGDNVLLLGEGNFSFARNLYSHNLPITITATCLNDGAQYNNQLENIKFLTENNVSVFLDVDATNVHEHPKLKSQVFSKIIFNFPHVGGKMKIQLNRMLVKKVCESSSKLMNDGGILIISLCNGQGGTPADDPQRKWDDSWQVTEMAAHGSFCLTSVEQFDFNNFESYTCTGYRSKDTNFNLNGALIHIFRKKMSETKILDTEELLQRLSLRPLFADANVLVPFYYSELYMKSPLNKLDSAVHFLKNIILNYDHDIFVLNDNVIPVCMEGALGRLCTVDGDDLRLRFSSLQIINEVVRLFEIYEKKNIFFPGMFFNYLLGKDFNTIPPISFQFLLLGENVSIYFYNFLKDLQSLFNRDDVEINRSCMLSDALNKNDQDFEMLHKLINEISNCKNVFTWNCHDRSNSIWAIGHELHLEYESTTLEAFVIYIDKICEVFFQIHSWKEMWSEDGTVVLDTKCSPSKLVLDHGLIYPLSYKFDITLRYKSDYALLENDVYEILRLVGAYIIREVELVSEYNSDVGWSSKCFRITYQTLNESMHRKKALDIHMGLVSKILTLGLPVTIN